MFITNKDRNGSAYIEFQYNDKDLKENKLLKVSNMTNFKSDSIYVYVDEIEKFLDIYEKYFNNGISPNGKNEFWYFGINYFNKIQSKQILNRIEKDMPTDYKVLCDWLKIAVERKNGFYILGI